MPRRLPSSPRQSQRGATLIEVIVSFLIVSFGLLAMVAMQSTSVKIQKTSEYRAVGALLAADLADRMRANRVGFTANDYNVTATSFSAPVAPPDLAAAACAASGACNAKELATRDLAEWQTTLFYSLPQGSAYVLRDAAQNSGGVDVWLLWVEPNAQTASGKAEDDASRMQNCPTFDNAWDAGDPQPLCLYFRVNI